MPKATRAPSQGAYRGALGRTTTQTVHITGPRGALIAASVHTAIDAATDPELAERLLSGDPAKALDAVKVGDDIVHVGVPLVYHDPAAEILALVLGEAHRHRELDERIALLEKLRRDDAAIPAYVKEFGVVFGAAGLRAYLEHHAERALAGQRELEATAKRDQEAATRREQELGRREREQELGRRERELERAREEMGRAREEIARQRDELVRAREELGRSREELDRMRAEMRARVLAAAQKPPEGATTVSPPPAALLAQTAATPALAIAAAFDQRDDIMTKPIGKQKLPAHDAGDDDEIATAIHAALEPAEPIVAAARTRHERPDSELQTEAAQKFDPAELLDATTAGPAPQRRPNGSGPHVPNGTGTGPHAPAPARKAFDASKLERDNESTASNAPIPLPTGSDPVTTTCEELPPAVGDSWGEFAATGAASTFAVQAGRARLALVVPEALSRAVTGVLDARIMLHRAPQYPVIVLAIAQPGALRVPKRDVVAFVAFDVAAELDHQFLSELAQRFELDVDVITRGSVIHRVRLVAPLTENVAYILRAADDHLRGITADGEAEPSFARARDAVLAPAFDILGANHAELGEFREDKLTQLATAQQLRRSIAIARRFARPSREDYLVTARGFPLARWHHLRRQVVEAAANWGLWMGPELAQVAVSEGLARSRRDLIVKLEAGFETLRRHPTAFDLDADAAEDNLKAIGEEAKALGVDLKRKPNGAIKSEDVATVSGSIERTPTGGGRSRSVEELLALLEDKRHRVLAAAELCDRADARAAAPVINAVKKMSRAEAVRILGKSVKFGTAAVPPLIEGLQSSKAFLRHGCALALALLRSDDGTHAVIQLLVDEPTEIWREIARAIGQIGPSALMPLASFVGRLGDRVPHVGERIAWAMAHLGVRGGKPALEQMSAGSSVVAPLAKQALGLLQNAARDEIRVQPDQPSRDVTVNRQFSRRFFEAIEPDRPEIAAAALHDLDASAPHELDEGDLIVEDEEESELDESDLIQS